MYISPYLGKKSQDIQPVNPLNNLKRGRSKDSLAENDDDYGNRLRKKTSSSIKTRSNDSVES